METIGRDDIEHLINNNLDKLKSNPLKQKPEAELLDMTQEIAEKVKHNQPVDEKIVKELLQLAGERGIAFWDDPKLLYLTFQEDKILLIDDGYSGEVGEKLGVAVHVPLPSGHVHYDEK